MWVFCFFNWIYFFVLILEVAGSFKNTTGEIFLQGFAFSP